MDIPLQLKGLENRNLKLRAAGIFSGPKILMGQDKVKAKRGQYVFQNNQGQEVCLKLKWNFIDPIPRLDLDGEIIQVARPLKWYEYAWMCIPLFLIFWGGAVGAMVGYAATEKNAHVFRGEKPIPIKFLLSGLITLGATVAFLVVAILVDMVFGQ